MIGIALKTTIKHLYFPLYLLFLVCGLCCFT